MSPVTKEFIQSMALRTSTLWVLGAYTAAAFCLTLWDISKGSGSPRVLIAQATMLLAIGICLRSPHRYGRVADWLPLASLPILYWGLPSSIFAMDGRLHDGIVQGWEQSLFGVQPARALAIALPSRPLSELLHLAYLLYYAIIYVPPAILYFSGRRDQFHKMLFAFTVTMAVTFSAFSLFPVEGPRFAWPIPSTVPDGPVRSLTLLLLEKGSSRGTAFPSSHVAIALTQTLSLLRWRRGAGLATAFTTLLLSIGAVYGGFHYATDIFAGVVAGFLGWSVAKWAERWRSA